MDSGALSIETRQGAVEEDEDIISNLHDSVISHIFSFLPTKDAVKTSVLSKVWIDKWTLITSLYFDDISHCDLQNPKNITESSKCFSKFIVNTVDRVSKNSTILSLTILRNCLDITNAVIDILSRRHIQNLCIQSSNKKRFSGYLFWNALFRSDSLVQLHLSNCYTFVPNISPCLPNLQILKLHGTDTWCLSRNQELFLKFPSLKVFEALNCGWCVKSVCLETPLLESLFMGIDKCISNYRKSAFKICTKSIKSLSCVGCPEACINLSDSSSPDDASIVNYFKANDRMHEDALSTYLILKQLCQVKKLKLRFDLRVLAETGDFVAKLPTFENLTYLQVKPVNDAFDKCLLELLHKSPNLKTLVLVKAPSTMKMGTLSCAALPYCFQSSLKVIKIRKCTGHESEVDFVNFMIKNAKVLEQMTIEFSS